jgi:SAM-dependent methyltransferase
MRALNLGCGERFRPDWVNVDFTSTGPGVIAWDLRRGIPFVAESFDLVYHSHILEHFHRSTVPAFLGECRRVLKPGGVIRIVVPDLEQITRLYLDALEKAAAGEIGATTRHEWMQIELCDQMTRSQTGGEWSRCFRELRLQQPEFIDSRVGVEGRWWSEAPIDHASPPVAKPSLIARSGRKLRRLLTANHAKESLLRALLGPDAYAGLQEGRFRQSGEVHRWMYDRVSLGQLLAAGGFSGFQVRAHDSSYLPDWNGEGLDTDNKGRPSKPDSLFVEALRP